MEHIINNSTLKHKLIHILPLILNLEDYEISDVQNEQTN